MFYVYDIETYPNVFTFTVKCFDGAFYVFEISDWVNDGVALFNFLMDLQRNNRRMVGYNNMGFDYPIVDILIKKGGHVDALTLFKKCDAIINGGWDSRFGHVIWEPQVEQVDLYKIHHFDNDARSTSLKMLEFNMRSKSIQDLPFPPGVPLTREQVPVLIEYNKHDVDQTDKFLQLTLEQIAFRDELTERYGKNFTNHNDTKIGKDIFAIQLQKAGIPCYDSNNKPIQTIRPSVALADVILPWIQFNTPEFQRILDWFKEQTITETKGVFKGVECTVDGMKYVFGTGGIHASVTNQAVYEDNDYCLIDLDVASYYPNLAIANKFYPDHLGEGFCTIYQELYDQRKQYAKGTSENAMLKLALNGVYGDSNNKYSPFYDPAYTMNITINGQLLLCLLAEYLGVNTELSIIQVNTDGLTVRCPRHHAEWVMEVAAAWESVTGLTLERNDYHRMFIRDVNNYTAEYTNGKIKRKGAYCFGDDLDWHQNHGSQIVQKAVFQFLINGVPIEDTITRCDDLFDFMLRTKVPRSSRLEWGTTVVQNVSRYYIAKGGEALNKYMPPTPTQVKKNADAPERKIGINVGWQVAICNDLADFDVLPIDYDFYIAEAAKLTEIFEPTVG